MPLSDADDVDTPMNMEDHFINSSGVVSWNFFSSKADYDYASWDFAGRTGLSLAALHWCMVPEFEYHTDKSLWCEFESGIPKWGFDDLILEGVPKREFWIMLLFQKWYSL